MRSWWAFCGVLLLAACDGGGGGSDGGGGGTDAGGGPTIAHATAAWRMRCTSGDCPAEDPPARMLDHDHGQDGAEVLCDLQFNGTTRRMDLTVRSAEGWGFEVRGATIGENGGRLMGSLCQIRVFEPGDVDLLTMCTSSNPSPGSACQISRIDIRDVDGVPTLLAELRCVDAPSEARPSDVRDVTSATSTSGNAELVFRGCAGL
ncbi:MAG: hypothetical protein KC619_18235 [Myxococcales bacterium]|nr:hypothetical protein [Myxococcales bacterium]